MIRWETARADDKVLQYAVDGLAVIGWVKPQEPYGWAWATLHPESGLWEGAKGACDRLEDAQAAVLDAYQLYVVRNRPKPPEPECRRCAYYQQTPSPTCRRYPPTAPTMRLGHRTEFPSVTQWDWCGEFKEREPQP